MFRLAKVILATIPILFTGWGAKHIQSGCNDNCQACVSDAAGGCCSSEEQPSSETQDCCEDTRMGTPMMLATTSSTVIKPIATPCLLPEPNWGDGFSNDTVHFRDVHPPPKSIGGFLRVVVQFKQAWLL